MALRKGKEHLDAATKRSSGNFSGSRFLHWEDGESKLIRFLTDTDDIVTVYLHEMVKGHNDKNYTLVCRKEFDKDCELCATEAKRREKSYGIAVEREEVREDGTLKGYRDVKTDSGEPSVQVIAMGHKNFWSKFHVAAERFGTLCDRDYDVLRRGKSMDTDYHAFPLDPLPIENFDKKYEEFKPDVEKMLERMASDEWYDKCLRGIEPEKKDDSGSKAASTASSESDYDLPDDDSELEKLRAKNAEIKEKAAVGNLD